MNKTAQILYPSKRKQGEAKYIKPGRENVNAASKFLKRLCTKTNLLNSAYCSKMRDIENDFRRNLETLDLGL